MGEKKEIKKQKLVNVWLCVNIIMTASWFGIIAMETHPLVIIGTAVILFYSLSKMLNYID